MDRLLIRRIPAFVAGLGLVGFLALPGHLVAQESQEQLPEMGTAAGATLTLEDEYRIGRMVMRGLRETGRILEDPETHEYLQSLGLRLSSMAHDGNRSFSFFLVNDPTINAFALPGGFIGIHSGLLLDTRNESELAGVYAHEIAHVTQRHLARQLGIQKQMQTPMMIAMAAAILLARSRPDLATGAMMAAQGGAVQTQLAYSRDFEREADRLGFQTLTAAGFDVRAMGSFFEKMQRYARIHDSGQVPTYLRSHPVTTERITDAQSRAEGLPYRQRADSVEYHLVRAKVRAEFMEPRDAIRMFGDAVNDRRFASEAAARFGLAIAHLRAREPKRAEEQVARLRAERVPSPMVDTLEARVRLAQGDAVGAVAVLRAALERSPHRRPVLYALLDTLQLLDRPAEVLAALAEPMRLYPRDPKLHEARARAYAAQGRRLQQHQSLAEFYLLRGSLPGAIEQLELARSSGEGDFYELSVVDARLKELRAEHARETQEARRRQ
jgi:beta-barrel assembly-enhancing protease